MKTKKTISQKVREAIPKILKEHGEMNFNDLFEKLEKQYPELHSSYEPRYGVLRGVLNKIDKIEIRNLGIRKEDNNVFYFYKEESPERVIIRELYKDFKDNLEHQGVLELDLLNDSPEKIEVLYQLSFKLKEIEELIRKL